MNHLHFYEVLWFTYEVLGTDYKVHVLLHKRLQIKFL